MSGRRQRSTKRQRNVEKNEDQEIIEKEPQGSFAWTLLKPSQVLVLKNTDTPEELQERMAMTLNLELCEVELKQACLLDYYVTAFHWGMEKKFDNRQLGGLMTLATKMIENIRSKNYLASENIKFILECFNGIGSESPEIVSIYLYFFTLQNSKDVIKYFLSTLFQHYTLYEFLFVGEQDELIIGTDLSVNVCPETIGPFPQPLEEAMPSLVFNMLEKVKEEENDPAHLLKTDELADSVFEIVKESDKPALQQVTREDIVNVLEKIRNEMIGPVNMQLKEKIKERELNYVSKINKLQLK